MTRAQRHVTAIAPDANMRGEGTTVCSAFSCLWCSRPFRPHLPFDLANIATYYMSRYRKHMCARCHYWIANNNVRPPSYSLYSAIWANGRGLLNVFLVVLICSSTGVISLSAAAEKKHQRLKVCHRVYYAGATRDVSLFRALSHLHYLAFITSQCPKIPLTTHTAHKPCVKHSKVALLCASACRR